MKGKIYDLYKWVPLVCANVLSAAVGSVLLLIGYYRENIPLLFICSFIFGHQVIIEELSKIEIIGRSCSSVDAVVCHVTFQRQGSRCVFSI